MKTKKIQKSKILNFNFKNLGNNILEYPYVEIKWLDIEGDAGWSSTKDLKNQKLPVCVSKGYLLSQSKGITRIFTDYIETKDKPTFDCIGNTTIIPTSVIQLIKKIKPELCIKAITYISLKWDFYHTYLYLYLNVHYLPLFCFYLLTF